METQAGPHNGEPKPVHKMEIQRRFPMEMQSMSIKCTSKPFHALENDSTFTQWTSKVAHTMEIQSWFTQSRSKAG